MHRHIFVFAVLVAVALSGCGRPAKLGEAAPFTENAFSRAAKDPRPSPAVPPPSFKSMGTGFETLYQLGKDSDASGVQAKMIVANGKLYGASHGGGEYGYGAVFTYSPGNAVERVIYSFKGGNDGWGPEAALTYVDGIFYGTTSAVPEPGFPTRQGNGTVFSIEKSGVERVLHAFGGSPDGANPEGALIDVNGKLYGTTIVGGSSVCAFTSSPGCGTVFSLDPKTLAEKIIYRFKGSPDGEGPRGGLVAFGGKLYGSTYFGGEENLGAVFSVTPDGHEQILHSFSGSPDGYNPQSELLFVNGGLIGTTNRGGDPSNGVVYSVTPAGMESIVTQACCGPEGGLALLRGSMYGTTSGDGASYSGNVFSVTHAGTKEVLHQFVGGLDGGSPEDELTAFNGTLYGTTRLAGAYNGGTIFKINP